MREGAAFFGRLEGIQGETGVWLGSQGISVMLDLSRAPIFMLPQTAKLDGTLPDTTPRVVMWKEMSALVEGSRFFVAGELQRMGSDLTFSSWIDGTEPPLVIMYDCPDSVVLDRAIWTGRQRNEYWNHITPVSLIVGFLGQLLWVMRIFEQSRLYALIGVVIALIPVLPLLPPGVLGYYVYRKMWRRARRIRATRDIVALRGLRSDKTTESLWGHSSLQRYNTGASAREILAVVLLISGMAVNAYIAALILAILLR
jgi:hypothetical protein